MKKMWVALIIVFFLGVGLNFVAEVQATTINIPSEAKFYFNNGTSFTHPGIYVNVSRVSNVWYFDGAVYPVASSDLSVDDAVGIAVAFGVIAIALAVVMPMVLRRKREE
jgi:hypothetical protein